jgi:hypothetical protein
MTSNGIPIVAASCDASYSPTSHARPAIQRFDVLFESARAFLDDTTTSPAFLPTRHPP